MADEEILVALKIDLQIATDKMDIYLGQLIQAARAYIKTEGIVLDCATACWWKCMPPTSTAAGERKTSQCPGCSAGR